MGREINPFGLRMPAELRRLMEKSAKINRRSLNAELVMRLQHSAEQDPIFLPDISEDSANYGLSEDQSVLIRVYNRMPARRRKLLLDFLKEVDGGGRRK